MIYKKSQIGATLTWVVAFFIFFFIIFFFDVVIWPAMGSVSKAISSGTGKVNSQDIDATTFDNFLFFLNSPIEYKGKQTNYKDAILSSINNENNEELYNLIINELNNYCSKYILLIPQGVVSEKGFIKKSNIMDASIFSNSNDLLYVWTPIIKYDAHYMGENYEILYRQLKECSGEEIESKNE